MELGRSHKATTFVVVNLTSSRTSYTQHTRGVATSLGQCATIPPAEPAGVHKLSPRATKCFTKNTYRFATSLV